MLINFEEELALLRHNTNHTAKILMNVTTGEIQLKFQVGGVSFGQVINYSDLLGREGYRPNIEDMFKRCQEVAKDAHEKATGEVKNSRANDLLESLGFPNIR